MNSDRPANRLSRGGLRPPPGSGPGSASRRGVRPFLIAGLTVAAPLGSAPGQLPPVEWRIPGADSLLQHPRVTHYLDYFTGPARERMARWLERGSGVRTPIRARLAREGLPEEFEFLPLIESGYSNTAVSRAGAVGMWQFIPETARDLGLKVNRFLDERRDPARATDAAARHLGQLARRFGSPLLAAAAYNAGAGRVSRALGLLPSDSAGSGDHDFFRLADRRLLAAETREYVPQLLAASIIGRDPVRFGFRAPVAASPGHDSVRVHRAVSLAGAARAIGLAAPELERLNPQFLRGVTPPGSPAWIRVPEGLGGRLAQVLPSLPNFHRLDPRHRPEPGRRIRVLRGDSVEAIAERHGVGVDALRRVNALPRWYRLTAGQMLRLPDG